MEDKERELYFGIINQLIQYNMQLTGQLMNLAMNHTFAEAMSKMLSSPPPPMPISFGMGIPANLQDLNKLADTWKEIPLPGEFMKDMMDAFLSKKDKLPK